MTVLSNDKNLTKKGKNHEQRIKERYSVIN